MKELYGGPITRIVKYYINGIDDIDDIVINLFVYPDKELNLVRKFTQVNAYMMFSLTQQEREHKPTRVTKFKEILKNLNIT